MGERKTSICYSDFHVKTNTMEYFRQQNECTEKVRSKKKKRFDKTSDKMILGCGSDRVF